MSIITGVDAATLRLWLGQAQRAYAQLVTGGKPVTVTYGQGDGQKSVTYDRTTIAALRQWIGELQAALGMGRSRRAATPYF